MLPHNILSFKALTRKPFIYNFYRISNVNEQTKTKGKNVRGQENENEQRPFYYTRRYMDE